MLRLPTFCMLLAFAVAQSGYDYKKPDKPFSQGTIPNQINYSPSPGGFQEPATTPSYQYQGVKGDDYRNSGGLTPTSPSSYDYTSGSNQGYSNLGQQNQPSYSSQTPSGPSFTGQSSFGPSSSLPEQTVSNYPGQEPNNLEQDQNNYPGQIGNSVQFGVPGRQNYPSQIGQPSGSPSKSQTGGQTYAEQPGQPVGGPSQAGAPGFGPSTIDFRQSDTGFRKTNKGFGQTNSGFGSENTGAYEGGDYSSIPGEPEIDYPILTEIPPTSFRCDAQAYPGYYADVETRCQVFHICANNKSYDFLCPNGTIFSQQVFVCVWWNQFDCNSAPGLYELNANLYDYSKIGSTSQNALKSGLKDFSQGQQGQSAYPAGAPGSLGASENYPGGAGTQDLTSYPRKSGSPDYPGISRPQGPAWNYPGALAAPSSLPGSSGSQGPSTGYQVSAPQTPPNSYTESAPQGPSNSYLGSQGPSTSHVGSAGQTQSNSYPGSSQEQPNSYPTSSPQGLSSSVSYPGSTSQRSTGFPGSGSTQGTSAPYSGSSVNPGFSSSGVPQGQWSKAPSSYSGPASSGSLGYPSGKPNGSSFPLGIRPQQPNREYLPPRN